MRCCTHLYYALRMSPFENRENKIAKIKIAKCFNSENINDEKKLFSLVSIPL
jgi:hypothetical protein